MLKRSIPRWAAVKPSRVLFNSQRLVSDSEEYNASHVSPKTGTFVQSDLEPTLGTDRPMPINVLMNRYKPLKHEPSHGNKVAEIQLRSFHTYNLDFFADFVLRAAFYLKIPAKGITPLHSKTERWTVIRSPFVHAKSKENFQRITHRRLITLFDANPEVIEVFLATLKKYSIAGVGVKANLYSQEDINVIDRMEKSGASVGSDANNYVDLNAASPEVAQAVLDILKDPAFGAAESDIKAVAQDLKASAVGESSVKDSKKPAEKSSESK